MDEFKNKLKETTGIRMLVYFFFLLLGVLVGSAIAALLLGDTNQIRLGQGISSTLVFVAPPMILYALTHRQPMQELGFRQPHSGWLLLVGVIVMFVSLPLTNLLTSWNEKMSFGAAFESLEELLRKFESQATVTMTQLLQANNYGELSFNLLVLALIPAIGEELTFRGVLQQALTKGMKNAHVAIILSAAIFSFIHFQFYGFLPRMFLGLLLGYMFYYSGSLWTSILMHFANNATAVVLFYLDYQGITNVEVDRFGSTSNILLMVASFVITVGLIVMSSKIKYNYGRKQQY